MNISEGTRASDGAIELDIEAKETVVDIDGRPARLLTYNGQLPGPLFVVREGERIRVRFRNGLDVPSNLHLHGMHLPPQVDDPHRVAQPGESLVYELDVPAGAAGTYWYHPHVHGEVAHQLGQGLAGALVVRGPDDLTGPLATTQEEVLVLQDFALEGEGPRARTPLEMHDGFEGDLVLVNGRRTPRFDVAGGLLRLRLVNASSARFYDVLLEGAETFLVGLDAALLAQPVAVEHVLMPPGQRVDLLVRATAAGRLVLRHRPYARGTLRAPWSRKRLPDDGVLAVFDARPAAAHVVLPDLRPIERLDPAAAVATRIFEFGGQGHMLRMVFELVSRKRYGAGDGARGPVRFWLNGREFEPGRIDAEAQLGSMEIWELRNPTPLDHPFHLHVYPFQVLDVDGRPPEFTAWQDVVNVPAGRTVRILVAFRDFVGVTMFHCHILEHEDNGMMGHLRVVAASSEGSSSANETPAHNACTPHA